MTAKSSLRDYLKTAARFFLSVVANDSSRFTESHHGHYMNLIAALDRDGFAVVPSSLAAATLRNLIRDIEEHLPQTSAAGVRGLCEKIRSVNLLTRSPVVRNIVESVLGVEALLVRSIFFNKSEQANWQVAWHQDLTIAVREMIQLDGFSSWSLKEGVPHVQPPMEVLERMLSVRLHLDTADESNGALWVAPGSHRIGRIAASEAAAIADQHEKVLCAVAAGDAFVFRPLLLHASRKVTASRPRRVIHLEFAGVSLPKPLAWATG